LGAPADVRFTPNSDRLLRCREMTLCAISDQSAVQQFATRVIGQATRLERRAAVLIGAAGTGKFEPKSCSIMPRNWDEHYSSRK
jgi:hypothetical protein